MFGVLMSTQPLKPTSFQPRSSATMCTMLGFLSAACAATATQAASSIATHWGSLITVMEDDDIRLLRSEHLKPVPRSSRRRTFEGSLLQRGAVPCRALHNVVPLGGGARATLDRK